MRSPFGVAVATMTIFAVACAGCVPRAAPDRLADVHSEADKSAAQHPTPTPALMSVSEIGAQTRPNAGDQITRAILRNNRMAGSRIAAVVDSNGTATLVGFVKSRDQELTALKTAQQVVGVTGVFDRLEIVPTAIASTTQNKSKVVDRFEPGSENDQVDTPGMVEPYRQASDANGSAAAPDRETDVTVNVNTARIYGDAGYGGGNDGYGRGNYGDNAGGGPTYPTSNDTSQTVVVAPYPSTYSSYFGVGGPRNFGLSRTNLGTYYGTGAVGHNGTEFVRGPSAPNGFPIIAPPTARIPVDSGHGYR